MHAVDTFAANAIARITRMTCTHVGSFGVVTSRICMARLACALVDIYDLWKQNGTNNKALLGFLFN